MRGITFARRSEDVMELFQVFFATQVDQQLQRFIEHFQGARIGAIDLVDDHNRLDANFERLAEHETRLRHRAFGSIDQHQCTICHAHYAFDFATKVRVTRRVDDVDLDALVGEGNVLAENRNTAFAFQIIAVQNAIGRQLRLAELTTLLEQTVHQRRLAVVDVGNDYNVSNIVPTHT